LYVKSRGRGSRKQLRGSTHFLLCIAFAFNFHSSSGIYLTQAVQSICYRTALTYWRRIKDETPGRTMGVIYWQLNDLWQGPTWSSLEYGGRWKALQYEVARAYAPIIVSGSVDSSSGEPQAYAYVTSDVNAMIQGTLFVNVTSWSTGTLMQVAPMDMGLPPLYSGPFFSGPVAELYQLAGCTDVTDCYLTLGMTVSSGFDGTVPRAEIYTTPLKNAPLKTPKLTLSSFVPGNRADGLKMKAKGDTPLLSATFTLSTDVGAANVFLETPLSGRFSDNAFVMDAATSRTLQFMSFPATQPGEMPQTFTLKELESSLTVRSIRDTYTDATALRARARKVSTAQESLELLAEQEQEEEIPGQYSWRGWQSDSIPFRTDGTASL
jgi:beta-mannosidase